MSRSRDDMERAKMNDQPAQVSANDEIAVARGRDIIVVGASAGAVPTLRALVSSLPADFPGSLFIVVHVAPEARSELAQILARSGPLHAVAPNDMDTIVPGHVYVSSPNCHMLVERDRIRIVRGPKENRHRP